ncbi:MAG: carbohydrate ABC transporter permease [Verrucomicrobia bacterium]|nr:carbohydrate ABC transporter permease [Verrucomicrobiota bacterium]
MTATRQLLKHAPAGKSRLIWSRVIARVCNYLFCLVVGSLMLLPLIWLVRSSLMSLDQIFRYPPELVPKPLQWQNYPEALTTIPFFLYLQNTVFILLPSVLGTVVTATLAAFGFSRLRWRGRDLVFNVLLSSLMLPYAITLIPTFILWARLGLVNSTWPLIVPRWFGGGAFYIFLLRQFFRTIPRELDEAALLDGANPLHILWFIIVPLSRPALIAVTIFSALSAWNDFLGPLIYLNDSNKFTLALGLSEFAGLYSSQWHLLMAAAFVVIAPVALLFFFAQKYFIRGIALTATK